MSFILRPSTGGKINADVIAVLQTKLGPIPVVFVVLVAFAIALEFALKRTGWGWRLRSAGSDESNARRIGVNVNATVILAFVTTSFLTFFGAIILMVQIGVGDPAQGGSFIGSLLGSLLMIQVINATVFLKLDQMWQYVLQGLLILVAAVAYSLVRGKRTR
jgi:ribose transport system ATP-binding protein